MRGSESHKAGEVVVVRTKDEATKVYRAQSTTGNDFKSTQDGLGEMAGM